MNAVSQVELHNLSRNASFIRSASNAMSQTSEPPNYRIGLIAWLFLVVVVVLCGRLVHLQLLERELLAAHANRQHSFTEPIQPRFGEILDRKGKVLATTITVQSLYVDPLRIEDVPAVSQQISDVLNLPPGKLRSKIEKAKTKRFLWVKRRLSEEETNAIFALGLPRNCWGFRKEYLRTYPQGKLAAHLLGLRNIDGEGQGGLEESFDEILKGKPGQRTLFRDARGKVFLMEGTDFEPPQHGKSIILTLDMVVQYHVEQELDALMETWHPKSCCAIVLDPHSGELLALASRPTFDPNSPGNVPAEAWKNRAIAAIYEPGSTFKPLIVSSALEQGVVGRQESFFCENGSYRMGKRLLHDHHRYGDLSLEDILVKSSNIGMAKIGERLENRGLHETVRSFGFGHKTGIPVPGELAGQVRPFEKWDGYSTGSVPMGQEIATTPLQMVVAHGALANGGFYISPRLVLQEVDYPWLGWEKHAENNSKSSLTLSMNNPEEISRSAVKSRILSEKTADWVVQGPMASVIKRGTGKKARLKEYDLFGKTGTSQKVDPKTGKYSRLKNISSFICGAPVEDPKVLVFVLADEPGNEKNAFGGQVAAPAAARIVKATLQHFNVPPKQ